MKKPQKLSVKKLQELKTHRIKADTVRKRR